MTNEKPQETQQGEHGEALSSEQQIAQFFHNGLGLTPEGEAGIDEDVVKKNEQAGSELGATLKGLGISRDTTPKEAQVLAQQIREAEESLRKFNLQRPENQSPVRKAYIEKFLAENKSRLEALPNKLLEEDGVVYTTDPSYDGKGGHGDEVSEPFENTNIVSPQELKADIARLESIEGPLSQDEMAHLNAFKAMLPFAEVAQEEKEPERKVFDPKQALEAVIATPKEERRLALEDYKSKLAWQRKGIAEVQAKAVDAIRANPNMSEEEFAQLFNTEATKFEASEEQLNHAKEVFETYQAKHQAVEKVWMEHETNAELFKAAFAAVPKGDVEVIKGPMSLYFRLRNGEDYALLNSFEFFKDVPNITPEMVERGKTSEGMMLSHCMIPELSGVVLVENAKNKPFDKSAQDTYVHEEQHAMTNLFKKDFDAPSLETHGRVLLASFGEAKTPEEKDELLKNFSRSYRGLLRGVRGELADQRAKGEILSYAKDGTSLEEILTKLTQGERYNYMPKVEEHFSDTEERLVKSGLPQDIAHGLLAVNGVEKFHILGDEYQQVLEEGVGAYKTLREQGYKEEAIRAILLEEPLARWGKVVGRMTEQEPEIADRVLDTYKEKFGMSLQDLGKVEGFDKLSEGQQLFVLKNLEQITLLDVQQEAKEAQKEEWQKKSWWKKALLGVSTMGAYGHARTKQLEKDILGRARGGNDADPERARVLAEQLENLEELTKVVGAGPEVEVSTTGELEIKYISAKDLFPSINDKHLTAENLGVMETFNMRATNFARLPREWGYTPKDEKEKKENAFYEKEKAEYERARGNILNLYKEKFTAEGKENPEKEALLQMNTIDERMQLNQLFNNHPDAEKALAGIEDQSVIKEGLKQFWQDKGKYVALGAGIRVVAGIVTGGVGALAVSTGVGGLVGGLQGKSEAKKLMRERRIDRRMSEEDEREEVSYETVLRDEQGQIVMSENGQPLTEAKTRKIKEFTDATAFVDRIDRLSTKLESSTDGEERALIEKKIAQTAALMEEKFNKGLVNFGGSSLDKDDTRKGNDIANRLSFMQALGKANAVEVIDAEALGAEIARMLGTHQNKIENVRDQQIVSAARKAGLLRAGFALAGGYLGGKAVEGIKEYFSAPDVSQTAMPASALKSGVVESVTPPIVPPVSAEVLPLYSAHAGESVTNILKEQIPDLKGLTPQGQENAIQNFLKSLSPEEKLTAGISGNPDSLAVGQTLNLEKLNTLLHQKQVGGENVLVHAQKLFGGKIADATPPLPHEVTTPQHEADAKMVSDYAKANPADRTIIAEVAGKTPAAMDKLAHVASSSAVEIHSAAVTTRALEQGTPWANIPEADRWVYATAESNKKLSEWLPELLGKDKNGVDISTWKADWEKLRFQSAEQVLGSNGELPWNILAIKSMLQTLKLTSAEGYEIHSGETLDAFIHRALRVKIAEGGPLTIN